MNFTEMEAKVREATNNDPWGKSTYASPKIQGELRLIPYRRPLYSNDGNCSRNMELVGYQPPEMNSLLT